MSNERDLELLRRIVERDCAALTELYLAYHGRVARFLRRLTRQHDLIENAISETLWIVWQKTAGFRGQSLVSTWIMAIAYRRALNLLRKNASLRSTHESDSPIAPDVHATFENWQWLQSAMKTLPGEQRITMELAYLMGHSCEEVAAMMQCPVNTVKTRMFHAREALRRSMPRLAGETRELRRTG